MTIDVIDCFGGAQGTNYSIHCGEDVTGDGIKDNFGSVSFFGQFNVPLIQYDLQTAKLAGETLEVNGFGVYSGRLPAGGAVRGVACVVTARIGKEKTGFLFNRLSGELLREVPVDKGFTNSAFSNINDIAVAEFLAAVEPPKA